MPFEAWFMDDSDADQREPHRQEPNKPVSNEQLAELGIIYYRLSGEPDDEQLEKIRKERGYSYNDVCDISRETLPNYDDKIKSFYEEHIHRDEEIRYIVDGSGYFDVRDKADQWVRIFMEKGDMIILPAGIYHRFTLDATNYIKAMRLFVGEPVWTPYNRSADTDAMAERQQYVAEQAAEKGEGAAAGGGAA